MCESNLKLADSYLGKIISNVEIAAGVWKMEIESEIAARIKVGQFIQIAVPEFYLRRPISVSEIKEDKIVILYKVLGRGTEAMTRLKDRVDILGGLGNGFSLSSDDEVVLLGGGVGVPPLYELAKEYKRAGKKIRVFLGFRTKQDVFYEEEFAQLVDEVKISTDDGSYGIKGNVMDLFAEDLSDIYAQACGPVPMLRAVNSYFKKGEISLEERMACGIGACKGCVVKTKDGENVCVCKEGPVFEIGSVVI